MEKLSNFATTTLSSGINNSVTSLTVASATNFPISGNFRITIDSEILLVTAVSGTTFTVVRGVEGTSAASHSSDATVGNCLTVLGLWQHIKDKFDGAPSTPGTYDEEFNGTPDTLPTNWSWNTTPSAPDEFTLNSRRQSLLLVEGTGNTTYQLTRASFAAASTFGLWGRFYAGPQLGSDNKNLRLYILNAAETEGRAAELYAAGAQAIQVRGLKVESNVEDVAFGSAITLHPGQNEIYFGLTRSSNNWIMWYSINGIAWQKFGSTQSHTFTVDHIKIQLGTTTEQSLVGIDWIRYRTDTLFPRP